MGDEERAMRQSKKTTLGKAPQNGGLAMPTSDVFNMDCLEYMRSLPDNAFDLCIADPIYGEVTGGLHNLCL